jgi:cysteine desulfurase / selenocysteine lyase
MSDRTKLVAVVHVSNTLGCINPVQEIIAIAHQYGAKVLIDACQSMPHMLIDVQAID